jgi:hypothetical protein
MREDARRILVAPQSLIWMGEKGAMDQRASLFDRLALLLGRLSQATALPGQVTVRVAQQEDYALIFFTPAHEETADLSRLYDAASSAAALSGGLLFIGQGRTFIQYRDSLAPRGYTAGDVKPGPGSELFLIDGTGTHLIPPGALKEIPLDDLLLRIAPLPTRHVELPTVLFALAAQQLYRVLAGYFRDHYLNYRVARFQSADGSTLILFEVRPQPDAPTGARVPAFVLSYLSGLPYAAVLTDVAAEADRRLLVEWGYHYPCLPGNIIEAFGPDSLVMFLSGSYFPNLHVSPPPTFFEGDELTSVQIMRSEPLRMTPLVSGENLPFKLPVRLVKDNGPLLPAAALILDAEEVEWVRRLLYRLPGEAFSKYTLCIGEERAVLSGEGAPLDIIPFGIPLQRVQDANLFIPLRTRFVPDLPWALLAKSLELRDGVYTFFSQDFRLDVPLSNFIPLSRALAGDTDRPRVNLQLRPSQGLPGLNWTPTPKSQRQKEIAMLREHARRSAQSEEAGSSWSRRRNRRDSSERPGSGSPRINVMLESSTRSAEELFKERAESFRKAGDHLSAALCYVLAADTYNAAISYQAAAQQVKSEKSERHSS